WRRRTKPCERAWCRPSADRPGSGLTRRSGFSRPASGDCTVVVTVAGELAVMEDQPNRRPLFSPRPVFVEDLLPPLDYDDSARRDPVRDLKRKLAYGLSCLLPRHQ